MRLLCLLADNEGIVVSRETIIKEIWDDYPGAGDGLNQGISHLRKVLEDDSRTMITTLPKIGYRFEGLTPRQPAQLTKNIGSKNPKKIRRVNVFALLVIIAIVFLAWDFFRENKPDKAEQRLTDTRNIAAIDESRQYFKEEQKQIEDSLIFVRQQATLFTNQRHNGSHDKPQNDSMEYWSQVQDRLLLKAKVVKESLDSLRKLSRP